MTGSRQTDRECPQSGPQPSHTLGCRSFVSAPLWVVFPGPVGPRSTALGDRHCRSTDPGALVECRLGVACFADGQVQSYTCA